MLECQSRRSDGHPKMSVQGSIMYLSRFQCKTSIDDCSDALCQSWHPTAHCHWPVNSLDARMHITLPAHDMRTMQAGMRAAICTQFVSRRERYANVTQQMVKTSVTIVVKILALSISARFMLAACRQQEALKRWENIHICTLYCTDEVDMGKMNGMLE